jgi:hypothetical protein
VQTDFIASRGEGRGDGLETGMAGAEPKVIFCDAVQTLGVHKGVAGVSLIRLAMDGKPVSALDTLVKAPT